MRLFTALIPAEHSVSCVDEECSNLDCVSSVFRTATLQTYNYNYIDKYVLMYATSERCSCVAGDSRGERRNSDKFFIYWVNVQQ